jgi:hypothetical protein
MYTDIKTNRRRIKRRAQRMGIVVVPRYTSASNKKALFHESGYCQWTFH